MSDWLTDIQGYTTILDANGDPVKRRRAMQVLGATVTDDGTTTIVSVPGGGPAGATGPTGPTGANGADAEFFNDWFIVTDFGAVGDGVTDDTAAIQNTIDACEAAGGGTVYFPAGVYIVNGALQDTGRSNSQLVLPIVDIDGAVEPLSIRLLGPARSTSLASVVGAIAASTKGAVVKSTLGSGTGALLGGWGPSGSFQDFTSVRVEIRDLTFRMPANPTNSCVDLSKVITTVIDGVGIDAGNFDISTIAAQTTATSYGLKLPGNNNGASTEVGRVDVVGFRNGVLCGEHTVAQHLTVWGCTNGVEFPAGNHASILQRCLVTWCKNGLVFSGVHQVRIDQLDVEHAASGTWTPTLDVSDASNNARGSVLWHAVLAGTGAVDTFLVSGAGKLKRVQLRRDAQVFVLTDGATVTVDCSVAESFRWTIGGNRTFANPGNPYDGQVINVRIIQDATGSRTWTLGSKFKFAGGAPALSTAAGARDLLSCQYDLTDDTWNCALSKGMA